MKRFIQYCIISSLLLCINAETQVITRAVENQFLDPKNILVNPGAENGVERWSVTGGTFGVNATSANVAFGKFALEWDASAAAQKLQSDTVTIPSGLFGQNCLLEFRWNGGDSNLTGRITDGTNTLNEFAITATTQYRSNNLTFICPSTGSLQVEVEASADAAVIYIDDLFLGKNIKIVSGSPEQWLVDVNIGGANVDLGVGNVSTYSAMGNASLDLVINEGSEFNPLITCDGVNAPSGLTCSSGTERVGVAFDLPRAGLVQACFSFTHTEETNAAAQLATAFQVVERQTNDDTVILQEGGARLISSCLSTAVICSKGNPVTVCGTFNFDSAGQKAIDVFFEQQALSGTAAVSVVTANRAAAQGQPDIHIIIQPLDFQVFQALQPGIDDWIIDGQIGGVNPSLGVAAVTVYAPIIDASLDLVVLQGSGLNPQITCASGTAPVGLTCNSAGVSEVIGISFNLPKAGLVEICGQVGWNPNTGAGGNAQNAFQFVETELSTTTIIQEGNGRLAAANLTGNFNIQIPVSTCSVFEFSSTGQKAIRFYYEQAVGGTLNSSIMVMDRAGTVGDRNFHFTIRPITQNIGMPIIVNSIATTSSGQRILNSAEIRIPAGVPTVFETSGNWISSISDAGVGNMVVNFVSGVFSGNVQCVCTDAGDNNKICDLPAATTANANVQTQNDAGTFSDSDVWLMCYGDR